jgi:hypothetical protein
VLNATDFSLAGSTVKAVHSSGIELLGMQGRFGHVSIQVTLDTYGRLTPGADVVFVNCLDGKPAKATRQTKRRSRNRYSGVCY